MTTTQTEKSNLMKQSASAAFLPPTTDKSTQSA